MSVSRMALILAVTVILNNGLFAQPKGGSEPLPDGALWRLGTLRLRHQGEVRQVAFAPDGKHIASIGEDQVFSLWDLKTGVEARRFPVSDKKLRTDDLSIRQLLIQMERHGAVFRMYDTNGDLTPDGKSLALSSPGKVRLLELMTGRETIKLTFKDERPSLVALSQDNKLLARFIVGEERATELSVVEVQNGKELHKLRMSHREHMSLMCFSPDRKYLAGANAEGLVSLWDLANGKRIRRYEMAEAVTALSFTPRGNVLASASRESVCFWDLHSEEETAKLAIGCVPFGAMAFSPDGVLLATSGKENSILLWDVAKGIIKHELNDLPSHVTSLAFSADGKRLVSGAAEGSIHLWNLINLQQTTPVEHRPSSKALAYFASDKLLVKTGREETLQQLDAASGKVVKTFTMPKVERREVLAITNHGRWSARGNQESGVVQLWDNEKNTESHKLEGHQASVSLMTFSPDGSLLATASDDKNLRVWDVARGKQIHSLETTISFGEERELRGIRFRSESSRTSTPQVVLSQDNRFLAALGYNGMVSLVEMTTGKERGRFQLGAAAISQLILSPDGRLMATLSSDDVVRVWDTLQGKLLHGFVHDGEIKVAALSFTSKLLAVGGANGNVTVYDLIQDKRRRHFSGHRAAVNGLHFAPGGGPLLSSGEDGLMFFWDVHAPPLADAAPEPGEADLSAAFDRLGHAEPAEAYKAIDELSAHPAAAIKLLKKRLKPAAPIDAKRVQQLVLDLRNASFAKRDHAMQELIKLDARVAPALEAVLRDNPNAETKRRIEKVFEALETKRSSPENLRGVRAVEVLERIGGTDAAAILQSLVAGAPGDRLTEAARESLRRNQ